MDSNQLRSGARRLVVGTLLSILLALVETANAAAVAKATPGDWIRPAGLASGCDGPIFALAVLPDGRLALGGRFASCGGVPAANVAIWDPQLGAYQPLGSGIAGGAFGTRAVVTAIHADANEIVVGGAFTAAGGSAASNLARYRFASQAWEPLGLVGNDGVDAEVTALARSGNALFVGGAFVRAGGLAVRHLGRFDLAAGTWSAFPAQPVTTIVRALAIADGALFVGGDERLLQAAPSSPVLRFDLGTSAWSTVASFDGRVCALAAVAGTLYAGGRFTGTAGGASLGRIARIDLTTLVTTPMGSGITGGTFFGTAVTALATTGINLYVAGDFSIVGGSGTDGGYGQNIMRFDLTSSRWASIGTETSNGMDGAGRAIAVANGLGYVAGGFVTAGGLPSRSVAAFRASEVLFGDGFEVGGR